MWDKDKLDKHIDNFMDRIAKSPERIEGKGDPDQSGGVKTYDRLPKKGDTVNIGPWVFRIKKLGPNGIVLSWVKGSPPKVIHNKKRKTKKKR